MVDPNRIPAADAQADKRYAELQDRLTRCYLEVFPNPVAPRTVLVIPSLTMDQEVMAKVAGVHHYEERQLCMLLLLRLPRTRVIYVTSTPIPDSIIDYYLHLLPGIPSQHARKRLQLISCEDGSAIALTQKILDRPRLIAQLRNAIGDAETAHMSCFTVTALEKALALRLDLPIYGCDPALQAWGSKSGSRRIFKNAGLEIAPGFEDLQSADDVARALADLRAAHPALRRAVVKLNDGFSGEGNATFDFSAAPHDGSLLRWIHDRLPQLSFESKAMTWELYEQKFRSMGGIVEAFVEGQVKRSPSVQFRVNPKGSLEVISTHDQVLAGKSGQEFTGCQFPADPAYRGDIQREGLRAAEAAAEKGVLGRFGIDFVSVRENGRWRNVAIEINLRKGGTTHPFLMLQFLTDGRYDPETGQFLAPGGQPCCYYATDSLVSDRYRGTSVEDLIDIAAVRGLHYHGATQEGVMFHLLGALSEFGKLGVVCIGSTRERADALYQQTVRALDEECALAATQR